MARPTNGKFRYLPRFVGHQPFIKRLAESVEPADVDAIFVSTIDDGERLVAAAELATKTGCPLVVMASGAATPESIAERLAHVKGLSLAVVPIPDGYKHPMLSLASDDHPFGAIRSVGDLSLKRNLVLCIGRMLGLRSMLLLDDDMRGATPELIRLASGHLSNGLTAVGFAGAGFPDHASVEHVENLVSRTPLYAMFRRETRGIPRRNVAVSGNSLLIDPSRFDEPFLTFYNEDWIALLPALMRRKVGILGEMVQLPYEPLDGKRPSTQEAGEILTEGLFALARDGKAIGDADIAFWEGQLRDRGIRLARLHRSLSGLSRDQAAESELKLLNAELQDLDPTAPETQLLRDEHDKLKRYLLARVDSPEGAELRRKALETIKLARRAHSNITAHDLHSAARQWREDQKRFAERLGELADSLPNATWQQTMDYFGLEAVWPYTGGPTGAFARQPSISTTTPRLLPRAERGRPRNEFAVDLPDGRHRIHGTKRGTASRSSAAVLLLHDLGGAPDAAPIRTWADRLRLERKDLLVLAPSLYHEEKDLARSARDCTLATSVSDLEHLIANLPELRPGMPLVVVGSGLGGLMATGLPPDRLDGLVLVNPNHPADGLFNQESPSLAIPDGSPYVRMRIGVGGIELPKKLREEYQNWPLREHLTTLAEANTPVRILAGRDTQRFARDYERLSPGSRLTISYKPDRGSGLVSTPAVVEAIALAVDTAVGAPPLLGSDQTFSARGRVPPSRPSTTRGRTPSPRPTSRHSRIGKAR